MTTSDDFERAFSEAPQPPPSRGGGDAQKRARIITGCMGLVLFGALGIILLTGQGGVVEVQDTQVAAVVNYLTGETEVILEPGYAFFIPFLEQAFLFDKSVQEFQMSGEVDRDSNHVSKLTVRANDGSNFGFDEVNIQYEIRPADASLLLTDSGSGEAFKANWVRAFARAILRDEFGKFSASEVADPTNYNTATFTAKERLNEALEPHGIEIIQIITPKPKFDPRYERAIEDRKVANQEVERIKARAEQLRRERERLLAEIKAEKAVEYEMLKGSLEAERIVASTDRVRVERSADAYKTRQVGEGQAVLAEMIERARAEREKAVKEAEGLKAKADALALQGEVLVRERLAQRLAEIEFELVPYTRDAEPERVELQADGLGVKGDI